ncbi:hypothetical protein HK098_004187 [Nowakowskiella sp. JEL0407]|nr:hypothetical protein HK098_004187 [Nowakowskiella sp. JEL0407]
MNAPPNAAAQGRKFSKVLFNNPATARRKVTLIRNGFTQTITRGALGSSSKDDNATDLWWLIITNVLTCCCPTFLLKKCLKRDDEAIQAFKEKLALCILIFFTMAAVGFITFGFSLIICPAPDTTYHISDIIGNDFTSSFAVFGNVHEPTGGKVHPPIPGNAFPDGSSKIMDFTKTINGKDLSFMFQKPLKYHACAKLSKDFAGLPCKIDGINTTVKAERQCHDMNDPIKNFGARVRFLGKLYANWTEIKQNGRKNNWLVYNGAILDISRLEELRPQLPFLDQKFIDTANQYLGRDATHAFTRSNFKPQADCLYDVFKFATVDSWSFGCVAARVLLYISFAIVLGIVGIKFILAIGFAAFIARRLGDRSTQELKRRKNEMTFRRRNPKTPNNNSSNFEMGNMVGPEKVGHIRDYADLSQSLSQVEADPDIIDPTRLHTIIMVPCYSEDSASLKKTLDSAAKSYYPATHKVIIVIADGIVQGHGNTKTTPDIVIDLMQVDSRFADEDPRFGNEPEMHEYAAVGEHGMEQNCAKVYAGWYNYKPDGEDKKKKKSDKSKLGTEYTISRRKEGRVPMILIVKCGNEEERASKTSKPGNRGKRDSQIILMSFLSKIMFNDYISPLEFDLFFKLWTITGVHPDRYEALMCLDADTEIYPDSMTHMVACLIKDNEVMGLCGETRVANKMTSWVTMIQVFEYYISHHLSKAFESVFGGVTCLPGCFSMYRIKAPKSNGYYVPILVNPDIVEEYSESLVNTLHKKNLLLLGEDRLLTTLMLRTFPKRSMIFVPMAICETVVPDKFGVLLSQRRRWINSTVHNLLELLLVKDLCGSFCFSMQFVIFMDLVSTIILPSSIFFSIALIILSIIAPADSKPIEPLMIQLAMIGLPAVLIVLTAGDIKMVGWMVLYVFSLPIWNVALPLYAFWNFDNFSWGQTRRVLKSAKTIKRPTTMFPDGDPNASAKMLKTMKWEDWMRERVREQQLKGDGPQNFAPTRGFVFGEKSNLPPALNQVQNPMTNAAFASQQSPISQPSNQQFNYSSKPPPQYQVPSAQITKQPPTDFTPHPSGPVFVGNPRPNSPNQNFNATNVPITQLPPQFGNQGPPLFNNGNSPSTTAFGTPINQGTPPSFNNFQNSGNSPSTTPTPFGGPMGQGTPSSFNTFQNNNPPSPWMSNSPRPNGNSNATFFPPISQNETGNPVGISFPTPTEIEITFKKDISDYHSIVLKAKEYESDNSSTFGELKVSNQIRASPTSLHAFKSNKKIDTISSIDMQDKSNLSLSDTLDVFAPAAIPIDYDTPRSVSPQSSNSRPPLSPTKTSAEISPYYDGEDSPPIRRPRRSLKINTTHPPKREFPPRSASISPCSTNSTHSSVLFPASDLDTWKEAKQTYTHILENTFKGGANGKVPKEDSLPCGCTYNAAIEFCKEDACGDERCINRALLIECSDDCSFGMHCQNKRFQRRQYAPLEIFRADKKGFGLRATGPIKSGDFVIEYAGEVISQQMFLKRTRQYHEEDASHFYFMSLKSDEYLDARKKGNLARFMNHSCNPNCALQKWVVNSRVRIGIFAVKDVDIGEELTFDYKFERYGQEAQPCYCGESVCTGVIGGSKKSDLRVLEDADDDDEDESFYKKRSTDTPPQPLLTVEDVQKVVKSMLRITSNKPNRTRRFLKQIEITESTTILKKFLQYHGLVVLKMCIASYLGIENGICAQVVQVLRLLPITSRNSLEDTKIEEIVLKYRESCEADAAPFIDELLESWRSLQTIYKIPKRMMPDETSSPITSFTDTNVKTNKRPILDPLAESLKRMKQDPNPADDVIINDVKSEIKPAPFAKKPSNSMYRKTAEEREREEREKEAILIASAYKNAVPTYNSTGAPDPYRIPSSSYDHYSPRSHYERPSDPRMRNLDREREMNQYHRYPQGDWNYPPYQEPSRNDRVEERNYEDEYSMPVVEMDLQRRQHNAEKALKNLISQAVIKYLSLYRNEIGNSEKFKKIAKKITGIVFDREKTHPVAGDSDKVTDELKRRVKKYIKTALEKEKIDISKTKSHDGQINSKPKKSEVKEEDDDDMVMSP